MGDERNEETPVNAAVAPTEPPPTPTGLEWLEPIYREHATMGLRTAHRVTGSAQDAEDVLQTVFMRLARRSQGPALSRGAGLYLRRAATNAALDLIRSRRTRNASPLEAVAEPEQDTAAAPDEIQIGRELRDRVRQAVTGLNPRNAQMFILRYFEGLDNARIAELFDTTPGTVAVTLHRARNRLLDELGPILGDAR